MIIILSPMGSYKKLVVEKKLDVLTVNGEVYDFSILPEGATLPRDAIDSEWIVGDVERINGEITLTMVIPVSEASTDAAKFPKPLISPGDGVLELPR